MSDDSCRDLASPGPLVARNTFKIISRVLGLSYCFCLSVKWMRSVCSKCKYSGSAVRSMHVYSTTLTAGQWQRVHNHAWCIKFCSCYLTFIRFMPVNILSGSCFIQGGNCSTIAHWGSHTRNGNMFPLQGRGALSLSFIKLSIHLYKDISEIKDRLE